MINKKWMYVLCVSLFLVSAWNRVIFAQLKAERADHLLTQERLEKSSANEKAWVDAYQRALANAKAQQENAQACLDREAKARMDATERAAILGQANPRPRPQQEQVVDDETRNRVAGRLNRPL